ncbi:MAG: hypothetical protein ABSA65_19750 [Acidimicrobiales bacterium]
MAESCGTCPGCRCWRRLRLGVLEPLILVDFNAPEHLDNDLD